MADVIFAHSVQSYIATRKGRALKLAPQVVAPGTKSAVYRTALFVVITLSYSQNCVATRLRSDVIFGEDC